MKKVAKMLQRHFENIITYLRHPITNAVTEGLNSKIQAIKANARGFRSFENYRTRILFFCGKLDLYPTPAAPGQFAGRLTAGRLLQLPSTVRFSMTTWETGATHPMTVKPSPAPVIVQFERTSHPYCVVTGGTSSVVIESWSP